jgi:hypothetical protein
VIADLAVDLDDGDVLLCPQVEPPPVRRRVRAAITRRLDPRRAHPWRASVSGCPLAPFPDEN